MKRVNNKGKRSWMDKTSHGYTGKPDGDSKTKPEISIVALRDLPKSSFSFRADPYTAALTESEPYPILNSFNKVVGGFYRGEDNIDGGNVQQYANSSTSKFLKLFDIIRTVIDVNYRYLPVKAGADKPHIDVTSTNTLTVTIDTTTWKLKRQTNNSQLRNETFKYNGSNWQIGSTNVTLADYGITVTGTVANGDIIVVKPNYAGVQLIEEMRKSIAESVSVLQATTFTQMAINDFAIITDLPMGSAKLTNIAAAGDPAVYAYTNLTDVLYAMSIYYQLVLQNALSVMNWHNSFRLKQGEMIRNAWNREVPNLNAFFGLMNKTAFLSKLNSINLSFEGEYIDKEFMEQINLLSLIPSRRSESMTDPVLELQTGVNHPTTFKVEVIDSTGVTAGTVFDDADMKLNINYQGTAQDVTFWEACDHLKEYLSMESTQYWARSSYTPAGIIGTDNARYNQINYLFDVIVACFTLFKPEWSDYREALDIMTRTGTISWTKGFRPSIVKDTDCDLFWNVLVDHIFQLVFSGAHDLNYDESTKRWRTYSLWDMYKGIPSYDLKSGGSFLTLSLKNISKQGESAEQYEYLPLLFEPWNSGLSISCVALSRDGVEAIIRQDNETISNNVILTRLAPLVSQNGLKIRVPAIDYDSDLTAEHYSNLYKMATQIFGLCKIQTTSGGSYDTALDPDLLAVYQIEVSDITNMAITYARANAPFRGTRSGEGLLGFSAMGKE